MTDRTDASGSSRDDVAGPRHQASTPDTVCWRLTLEPVGTDVPWSLIVAEPGQDPTPLAAGVIRNAVDEAAASLAIATVGEGLTMLNPLIDPPRERATTRALGKSLLPAPLRAALTAAPDGRSGAGVLHSLDIAARGWLAGLPWDAMIVSDPADSSDRSDRRLVEAALICTALAPGVAATRDRRPRPVHGRLGLSVIDAGPAFGAPAGLSPVFPGGYPSRLVGVDGLGEHEVIAPNGSPMSAGDFGETLRDQDWARLLYLGHISGHADADPSSAALVFDRDGVVEELSARTWLASPDLWPAPPRVALIGCGSDDGRWHETSGLPAACVNAGADLVTATRWTLPADAIDDRAGPVAALAVAVNRAHTSTTPIRTLRAWQLGQLQQWRTHGLAAYSPLFWAALATYRTPVEAP